VACRLAAKRIRFKLPSPEPYWLLFPLIPVRYLFFRILDFCLRPAQVTSVTFATAVEEQSATTNEIARNVAGAANGSGSGEITHKIEGVGGTRHFRQRTAIPKIPE
jgi:hypothetical protein